MKKNLFHSSLLLLLAFSSNILAATLPSALVDVDWLKQNINKVTVVEVRQDIKSFSTPPAYKTDKKTKKKVLDKVGGHIDGAHLINYKKIRGDQIIDNRKVSKMIADKASFEKLMQSAGINKDDAIVIVTKGHNSGDITIATRYYWTLKYYGHKNMAILDGGIAAWIKAGNPVTTAAVKSKKGNWTASDEDKSILATSKDVEAAIKNNVQLVDSRDMAQYLGTWHKSYVYAGGHIPGAKNYPADLLTKPKAAANFLPVKTLDTLHNNLGIKTDQPVITYCNSGHLATGSWFVLSELLGNKQAKMYDGSMHQWTLEKHETRSLVIE